jgi:hypothetical protein
VVGCILVAIGARHMEYGETMCGSSGGCYSDRVCSSTEVISNGGLNADGNFPDRWA